MNIQLSRRDALIRIDIQNDFLPGGALAVPGGDEIIDDVNRLSLAFRLAGGRVVDTQDWHPAIHSSFASNHEGAQPFGVTDMPYGVQVLWPDHCVQDSQGAEFAQSLNTKKAHAVIRKGMNPEIDSYSAFFENDKRTVTGLSGYLNDHRVKRVFLVGLALDFCVGFSALDARREGFETYVVVDLCRAIDLDGSLAAMMGELNSAGVILLNAADIAGLPHATNTDNPIDFPAGS